MTNITGCATRCKIDVVALLVAVILGSYSASLTAQEYEEVPAYKAGEPYWYQKSRIHLAFADQSQEKLDEFFSAWATNSVPRPDDHQSTFPEPIAHAYSIFEDFYQPRNLGRIGDPEWGNDQFEHASYFITQSSLQIVVSEKTGKSRDLNNALKKALYVIELQEFKPKESTVALKILS